MSSDGDYLYSSKLDGGTWVISSDIGSLVIKGMNKACKDEKTPAGCKYGWRFAQNGGWEIDPAVKLNCKHFN